MNRKTIITYIAISCLLAILICWHYYTARKQMMEVAERTFVEAVHQDLDERWKKLGKTYSLFGSKEKKEYTTFSIKKSDFEESVSIKGLDYSQNVETDINRRLFHSVLSKMSCDCKADSLNYVWQKKLLEAGMDLETSVIVTKEKKNISAFHDSLTASFNSLPLYYAGVANEIQLNGFIWLSVLDVFCYQPLLSLCVGLLIVWIVFMVWKISSKTKPLAIPEKEGHRLSQHVVYDSDARCFLKDGQKIILPPKGNLIIKALLEADNHQLHGADLLAKVWDSNETNMNKLYIQNSKLRTIFKDLGDGFDIVSIDRSHFRLVFPDSREHHNTLKT